MEWHLLVLCPNMSFLQAAYPVYLSVTKVSDTLI